MESSGQLATSSYLLPNIIPDSLQVSLANQLRLNSFIVPVFNHIKPIGQISKETEPNDPDARTIFLIGLKNDSIIIVADANNNNRLGDDKIIIIDREILKSQSIKNLERLPLIQINNYKQFTTDRTIRFRKRFT
jgi:hypothetical protein